MTGASGFIGSRLVDTLRGARCQVRVIAREDWEQAAAADVICHLAAQTSVPFAEDHPEEDCHANVGAMHRLISACEHGGRAPIVIFAGTVTQAGIQNALPVSENVVDAPATVYDRHKLMAENALKEATRRGAVRGVSLRLSNVYGPGGHGRNPDRDVLNRMIRMALSGQPLTVFGSGAYVRDYLFIDDAISAFAHAAASAASVSGRHFVIGSGHGVSISDAFELIASRVSAVTARRVDVIRDTTGVQLSPIQQRSFIADTAAFSAATGWRARRSLADGIDRTIQALQCE